MTEEKLKPLVIGNAESPRSFKKMDIKPSGLLVFGIVTQIHGWLPQYLVIGYKKLTS